MAFRKLRPFESLYNTIVRNAKIRNKKVYLSYEEFLEFTNIPECHYCGHLLIWRKFRKTMETYACNLDCKDNNKGYSKENCVPCCHRCNDGKGVHFSYDEWVKIGNLIRTWTK